MSVAPPATLSASGTAAQYKKHTHREHILELPDTYIGSVDTSVEHRWIWDAAAGQMAWRAVSFCPGFLKIFDEILVNALDHRVRMSGRIAGGDTTAHPVKHIDVTLSPTTITVRNDGDGIPVEIHPDSGIWAPELVFGHLLTSSNYDKSEEKIVGGKNGYGGKCLEHTTILPLWNGVKKMAKDISVGDVLIGDDGTPRTVLSTLCGTGKLFTVNQANGDSYTVNADHTLTLMMPDHKAIFWNTAENGWSILWWNNTTHSINKKTIHAEKQRGIVCKECGEMLHSRLARHYARAHHGVPIPSKQRKSPNKSPEMTAAVLSARLEMEEFAKTIDDNNVFDISIGDYMALNTTTQLRLAGTRGKCVQYAYKEVELDPYMLGLWLGDRSSSEYGIVCYGENKHIPAEYIQNDRATRLAVLAGIIDAGGSVSRKGTRVGISQDEVHKGLAYQIVDLARSLGFYTTINNYTAYYTYKGEKRSAQTYKINISGTTLADIPTRLPHKKTSNTVTRVTSSTGKLNIVDAGIGNYIGIKIDGNERFALNDFTITHNCTNIFSNEFTLDTVDHRAAKKYTQTWTSNMSVVSKPKVKAATGKPYTELTFTPDLSRFNWPGGAVPSEIPADMLAVIATRVVDAAACAGKDCRVTLNGAVLGHNTFPKYIGLFLSTDAGEGKHVAYESAGERWEVGAILTKDLHGDTPPDERHISFVNGIATRRGGKHVELVTRTVLTEFCAYAKRKAKLDLTPALLKDAVVFFINSTIVNPSFDTQTKETLTTPPSKFGSTPVITPKFIDGLAKIGLLEEAAALLDAKTAKDAKKTDGKKKSTLRGIPKLDDATWAGTSKSVECTLILTEGDSAKTTAISGLKVVGREKYGVFPLKGKILNVKDISADKKMKNAELTCIKQILGLEAGKKYTDLKQLRYGRVMIMTDQDVDGSHIKGLLMNLFHTEWPELLHLGFLCCLMTPLLKATRAGATLCFYSESEYDAWKTAQTTAGGADVLRGWHTKYYKGLGTSTAAEAREYFASMNTVEYTWDDASDGAIDLAFNKKRSDDRKSWLETFDASRHLEATAGGSKVGYSRFVHDELIHFSVEDNTRSIPHVIDGLKPSQRKIFWAALKRNLFRGEIRVAQLAGYVSEHAAYHHGEASLTGAIVKMAQNFVGSNNLNLLSPNGQFGTRLMGGDDAASARYIHTELMSIVRALVKKEDDAILDYTVDDGTSVEPVTYMPVIPLLLVNGATGIGTGFSTDVLPYNPKDLVGALKWRLGGGIEDLSTVELIPWWYGFKGRVNANDAGNGYVTRGIYEFVDDDACTVRITELPVGIWTQNYKEYLESVLVEQETALAEWKSGSKKKPTVGAGGEVKPARGVSRKSNHGAEDGEKPVMYLRGYTSNYNDVDVDFTLELEPDYYHTARAYPAEFEAKFKLTSSFRTTNMVAFNSERKIKRYESAGEILEEFYGARLAAYGARKTHMLERMAAEIVELEARLTFIRAVVDKHLVVANAEDDVLLAGLEGLSLPKLSSGDGLRGYEYLLKMRIDRIKAVAVSDLTTEVASAKAARDTLLATTLEQLWLADLDEFSAAWTDYMAWRETLNAETAAESRAATTGKKVKKAKAAKN